MKRIIQNKYFNSIFVIIQFIILFLFLFLPFYTISVTLLVTDPPWDISSTSTFAKQINFAFSGELSSDALITNVALHISLYSLTLISLVGISFILFMKLFGTNYKMDLLLLFLTVPILATMIYTITTYQINPFGIYSTNYTLTIHASLYLFVCFLLINIITFIVEFVYRNEIPNNRLVIKFNIYFKSIINKLTTVKTKRTKLKQRVAELERQVSELQNKIEKE